MGTLHNKFSIQKSVPYTTKLLVPYTTKFLCTNRYLTQQNFWYPTQQIFYPKMGTLHNKFSIQKLVPYTTKYKAKYGNLIKILKIIEIENTSIFCRMVHVARNKFVGFRCGLLCNEAEEKRISTVVEINMPRCILESKNYPATFPEVTTSYKPHKSANIFSSSSGFFLPILWRYH